MKLLNFGRTARGGASSLLAWERRTKKFRLADPAPCIKPENPPQVLVVDDDPVILNTTASHLQAAGYQVATAVDGSEAISALSSQKPQFILVDQFPAGHIQRRCALLGRLPADVLAAWVGQHP